MEQEHQENNEPDSFKNALQRFCHKIATNQLFLYFSVFAIAIGALLRP